MNLHRILSGTPEHRRELIAAGIFVLVWFGMDVVQFVDWVNSKISPTPSAPQFHCGPVLTESHHASGESEWGCLKW